MFNDGFYPTPDAVIDQMLAPYTKDYADTDDAVMRRHYHDYWAFGKELRILEPSAGKGNILDRLADHYHVRKDHLFAIECEPELQMILNEKQYQVIDSDFLEFHDPYWFDMIVMNPPFDDGAGHLLKAWEILTEGDIACLLNAETVRNPYTKEREVLSTLIEAFGNVEYIGQVFLDAERSTDVEVAIVWLHKERSDEGFSFDPGSMQRDHEVNEEEFSANPLASQQTIANLVFMFEQAVQTLIDIRRKKSEYDFYIRGVQGSKLRVQNSSEDHSDMSLDEQIDALKRDFWQYVFAKTRLGERTTSNFRREFDKMATQTGRLAFSEANINRILSYFLLNSEQIIMNCIIEVFDKATSFHKDNIVHSEGWSHNKSWKIAPLIIIPWGINYDSKYDHWDTYWDSHHDFYGDLDKALCFLTGEKIENILTINTMLEHRCRELNSRSGMRHDGKFHSSNFEIRIFKKKTVHLKFHDLKLLEQFNMTAARGKKWVGSGI